MHNFYNNKLPFSFAEMWTTNRDRNPNMQLRNADDFVIPAHRFETLKRMPLFNFPRLWNTEDACKFNQPKKQYQKGLKSRLIASLNNN